MTYNIGKPSPGLGRAQQCDGMKRVNGIQRFPSGCLHLYGF